MSRIEMVALGLFLLGTAVFFAWVAILVYRK